MREVLIEFVQTGTSIIFLGIILRNMSQEYFD